MSTFGAAQRMAIKVADDKTRLTGLPTYTELREALKVAHAALFDDSGDANVHDRAIRAIDAALGDLE